MTPAVAQARIAVDARLVAASGIGTYLSQLLPRLISARDEFHFTVLGPGSRLGGLPWTRAPNVQVVELQAPIYSVREQVALPLTIPAGTDVFWSPHYNIPLAWRGRLIATIHDLAHLALPELVAGAHRRAYARFMFKQVARRADAIIAVSDFTRTEFERLVGSRKASPEVIHSGVDSRWFALPPSRSPHPVPYLLYVGNVKPHKNLGRLLEAFSQVTSRIPWDLLILGKDEGFLNGDRTVRAAADRLAPRVQMLGSLHQNLLEQYLAHAGALVLPSLYEGFGLPPLEAMACGCPVIVSRASSLPEICADAAIYCDPLDAASIASAIVQAHDDGALRETLRGRGLDRARQFTWERSARSTLALLDRVLGA